MSVLRYLTPAKGAKLPPVKGGSDTPTLTLRVPNYGILFVPVPEPESNNAFENAKPREDHVLTGELEVQLREPRRVKCIRVGLKTIMMADFGGKKLDEDTLFHRKVEMIGGNSDGLWLPSGSQKFRFSLIVPANHPVHDWHPNAKITHHLYAELEGIPDSPPARVGSSSSLFSFMGGRRSSSHTPRSASPALGSGGPRPLHSPPRSGASTPITTQAAAGPIAIEAALAGLQVDTRSPIQTAPTSPVGSPGLLEENAGRAMQASSMSITRQELYPQAPAYEETDRKETEPEWLHGTVSAKRSIMLMYNPDPNGGVTEFDDCPNGYAPGLGIWNARYRSDVWTVCALLKFQLSLTSIPPTATIFTVRLVLEQSHTIVSPRDTNGEAKKVITTRHFSLHESGRRPPQGSTYPGKDYAAAWRGPGAGGKEPCGPEGGEFRIDTTVRLPKDDVARPTTPAGVVTPITVGHKLVLEVFFSVYGEDDRGRPLQTPGPGGLRMLRVGRPVMIPSCSMIPPILDLPTYGAHVHDPLASDDPIEAAREDIGWEWCACGQKLEDMEARMRSHGGLECSERSQSQAQEDKIWAERGRQGSR